MRYILEDNNLKQVTFLKHNEKYYINPTDEQIDEFEAGYQLIESPQTSEIPIYTIQGNKIIQSWEE